MNCTQVTIAVDLDKYIMSQRKVCETDVLITADNNPGCDIKDFNDKFSSQLQRFRNNHEIPVSEIDNIKVSFYTADGGIRIHCKFSYQKPYSLNATEIVSKLQSIVDEHMYK